MPLIVRILCAVLLLVNTIAFANPGNAQVPGLPIPGVPGGLGGIGTEESQQEAAPEADGQQSPTAPTAPSPAETLIEILRDDAARESLIRELERAASGEGSPPASSDATPAEDTPDVIDRPEETFGARAVDFTRTIGERIAQDLSTLWLRAQRIPNTIQLSLRAFEGDVLEKALREAGAVAIALYSVLLVLRILTSPIRRRFGRAADGPGWLKRVTMRLLASALDLSLIPLAIFLGIFGMIVLGFVAEDGDDVRFTDAQALFVNAFAAVEGARAALRFVLSPRTSSMRLIGLGERAVMSLWRAGQLVIFVLGYGQLLIVPAVSEGISLFVGRAVASVIAATVEIGLILYVLSNRRAVADWLAPPGRDGPFSETIRALATRWHWPVMAYLLFVLTVVLTRPGNVLLPLLWTTAQVVLVSVVAAIVFGGLSSSSTKRLKVPATIASRLPLLEMRLNSLVPAFLKVLRLAVIVLAVLVAFDVLEIQSLGGLLSSDLVARITSGLFSVLLIALILAVIWLGMVSWVDYRLNPFIGNVPTPRETTLLTLMRNAVTVALVILGVITSLAQLGMNVGPLIASAGVIGLAISFGAQRMVEDVFSGIFIQAEGAMNVGDVVDVGGTVGTVEKLTVRSVTLRDLSGIVHVIPFSSAAKISNYMRDFAYHVADVGVAYREDIEDVKQAMLDGFDLLKDDPDFGQHIIGDLEWFGLNAFGASELQMRARIKTVPGQQWAVGRAYNAIIKRLFDERGIEIPFPHQTVYFGEDKGGKAPPIHVQMQGAGVAGTEAAKGLATDHSEPPGTEDEAEITPPRPATDFPDSADR